MTIRRRMVILPALNVAEGSECSEPKDLSSRPPRAEFQLAICIYFLVSSLNRTRRFRWVLALRRWPGERGAWAMVMKTGERWHCTNPACKCSILVEASGEAEGENPLCACGGVMKKQYAPPVFQYLDFLRFPESEGALKDTRKD